MSIPPAFTGLLPASVLFSYSSSVAFQYAAFSLIPSHFCPLVTHAQTHTEIHIHIQTHMHAHTDTHTCTQTHTQTHTHSLSLSLSPLEDGQPGSCSALSCLLTPSHLRSLCSTPHPHAFYFLDETCNTCVLSRFSLVPLSATLGSVALL